MKVLVLFLVIFIFELGTPGQIFAFVASSLFLLLYTVWAHWASKRRLARIITSQSMCATPEQERALSKHIAEVGQTVNEMIGSTGSGDAG